MEKLGRKIVKLRIPIFIISILLLIPATIGYINTRVNYDILSYLPDDIETMKGQDILVNEFGTGAYSMFICEGMENKDVAALKQKIEDVEHVSKVVWYDSLMDISVPMEMLPEEVRTAFNSDDSTMMFIIFDTTTSADETMEAIGDIRHIAGKQFFERYVGGGNRYEESGGIRDYNLCSDCGDPFQYCACAYHGNVFDSCILFAEYRYGDFVQYGNEHTDRRNFLHNKSFVCRTSVGSDDGLFYFLVAQLSGKEGNLWK